ncbi:MAG: DUF1761 domain-containing protein [Pseudomonadota bacterium]
MSMAAINLWAVVVAAVSAFALGAVWYGPLFSKSWQSFNGLTDADVQSDAPRTFGGAFALTLIAAFGLAMLMQLHPAPGFSSGFGVGSVIGLSFIATSLGINYLFARKPLALYFIDAGYLVIMVAVMATIIGGWR